MILHECFNIDPSQSLQAAGNAKWGKTEKRGEPIIIKIKRRSNV